MRGIGASQGIAIGRVYVRSSQFEPIKESIENADAELEKLYINIEKSRQQLQELKAITEAKLGTEEGRIFEAHILILQDPELIEKAADKIKTLKVCAAWAVHEAAQELARLFEGIEDAYIRERVLDVQDVSSRIINNILGMGSIDFESITEPVIIAAKELTPSDMANIPDDKVLGIITEAGGTTSHTAIMSRVMGLPAVVGAEGLLSTLHPGDVMVLDGSTGEYHINPEASLVEQYQEKLAALQSQIYELQSYIGKKTVTLDGYEISIGCNIGSPKDLDSVLKNDGEGIGLFRSEFLYMDRDSMPSEEEQFEAYKAAAVAMGSRPVIIRTLDIGGDKQLSYISFPKEENPFLGYRAIRYCLEETEVFRIQLRAMLRASAFGNIKIMLPMIISVEEVKKARQQLEIAMKELDDRQLSYDKNIQLGIMIETPAAAIISDQLAEEADFFSIGTNDLTQYTLAVDRMNSKISELYSAHHPAVLRLIKLIVENAKKAGVWVGMCGEAAQDERLVPLFTAMGLDELSVSPPQVLKIRKLVMSLNTKEMQN